MRMNYVVGALAALAVVPSAYADSFVNGDFETGTKAGWTFGGGYRNGVLNTGLNALSPTTILPGGPRYDASIAANHSAIISAGTVDPRVGAAFGSTVYAGGYSLRVEDTITGGYASVAVQRVNNYSDSDIFFAWKAVLLGAHGPDDAATMIITLKDLTTNTTLITRQYNAASGGSGIDPRFTYQGSTNNFYTPQWQIEQLSIDASLLGHDFEISVLASDCEPTGHWGYVYLDGFGSVTPPSGTPEPGSLALAGVALAGLAAARRRKRA